MRRLLIAIAAAAVALFGLAPVAQAEQVPPETVDYCNTANKPSGSVAAWLDSLGVDKDCVEVAVTTTCGQITASLTNKTNLSYGVILVPGGPPTYDLGVESSHGGSISFAEDEGGGSVEVWYYIVGAEKDYLTGSGRPNFWDQNAASVTVTTDCEATDPVDDPTDEPTGDPTEPVDEPTNEPTDEPTEPAPVIPTAVPAGVGTLPETGAPAALVLGLTGAGLAGLGGGLVRLRRRFLQP